MKAGVALADLLAGKDAAIAILAALTARARGTPHERQLHVSLATSAVAALANVGHNVLVSGRDAGRWGNAHPNLVPYQLFETADRPLVIAVGTDAQWVAAARAIGCEALAADPALATNAGRVAARDHVVATMAAQLRTQPAADWIAALDAARVPCGLVRSVQEALANGSASAVTGLPPAVGGRQTPLPPPALDAHGADIRARGWSALEVLPTLPAAPL
jgi:crotonobetainyl-CoA:carnitine CoA-transferase CaiB-like acyl-CoA transferase